MRTWVVVAAVVLVGVLAFAMPTRSQDKTRIGALIDITAITSEFKGVKKELTELKKQNEELKNATLETNKTLEVIAAGVRMLRMPPNWEYRFLPTRNEKVLNKMGEEGWELVTVYERKDWFVFRRPVWPKPKDDAAPAVPQE